LAHLRRITRIDRAVLAALGPELLRRVIAEDDVLALDAERLEVRPPDRRGGINIEHARDADLDSSPPLVCRLERSLERASNRLFLDAAEQRALHLDVFEHRAVFRERLRRVEAAEEHLALVVNQVRILEPQILS